MTKYSFVFSPCSLSLFFVLIHFVLFSFALGTLEQIIGKYFATVVGFYVVSRPFMDLSTPRFMSWTFFFLIDCLLLNSFFRDVSKDILIEEYYQSGRMLLNLAQVFFYFLPFSFLDWFLISLFFRRLVVLSWLEEN